MSKELSSQRWKNLCIKLKKSRPPVCWVCGGDIDLTISGREKWGWTLDHVIPRVVAPELMWDESNLKPAHSYCNSIRGMASSIEVRVSRKWKAE